MREESEVGGERRAKWEEIHERGQRDGRKVMREECEVGGE